MFPFRWESLWAFKGTAKAKVGGNKPGGNTVPFVTVFVLIRSRALGLVVEPAAATLNIQM